MKTIINKNEISDEQSLMFKAGNPAKDVLKLMPNGHIIWTLEGKQIVIKDQEILCFALLDLVIQLTAMSYDWSKIDQDLYTKYTKFLEEARVA